MLYDAIRTWSASSSSARLAQATALSLALHGTIFVATSATPPSGFAQQRAPGLRPLQARLEAASPREAQSPAKPEKVAAAADKPARKRPPDSGYFTAKNVDVRAAPEGDLELTSPDETASVEGMVVLRLQISAQGTVDHIIVVRAVPDYAFGPSAFGALRRARFTPARKAGLPVPSEMVIEVRYGPPSRPAEKPRP